MALSGRSRCASAVGTPINLSESGGGTLREIQLASDAVRKPGPHKSTLGSARPHQHLDECWDGLRDELISWVAKKWVSGVAVETGRRRKKAEGSEPVMEPSPVRERPVNRVTERERRIKGRVARTKRNFEATYAQTVR